MKIQQLKEEILQCRECEELFGYEPHPVFFGHSQSKVMQISQAPSLLVHETGKPFNDLSGKKLRREWYQIEDEMFYNPDYFYITSMAHCYPGKSPKGGDRIPPKNCAKKWMLLELESVDNLIYIIIGRHASDYFFPKKNFTDLVFQDQVINGKPAYVLPHPSPLNTKWLKDRPEFEKKRMPEIRKVLHNVLNIDY